jgi:hypothetical protein
MTLEHMQELFGELQGFYFYRLSSNKTDLQILQDVDQTIHTAASPQGLFIKAQNPVTHIDYTRIES